jgi:hypothetical protein
MRCLVKELITPFLLETFSVEGYYYINEGEVCYYISKGRMEFIEDGFTSYLDESKKTLSDIIKKLQFIEEICVFETERELYEFVGKTRQKLILINMLKKEE